MVVVSVAKATGRTRVLAALFSAIELPTGICGHPISASLGSSTRHSVYDTGSPYHAFPQDAGLLGRKCLRVTFAGLRRARVRKQAKFGDTQCPIPKSLSRAMSLRCAPRITERRTVPDVRRSRLDDDHETIRTRTVKPGTTKLRCRNVVSTLEKKNRLVRQGMTTIRRGYRVPCALLKLHLPTPPIYKVETELFQQQKGPRESNRASRVLSHTSAVQLSFRTSTSIYIN